MSHAEERQIAINAMIRLGNYHQVDHTKDPMLAFECYLKAAQLGSREALTPLERLTEDMGAEQMMLLVTLYKEQLQHTERAKYWEEKANGLQAFGDLQP